MGSMSKKLPAMMFYPLDYLRDTRMLSLPAKGAWSDLLMHLWGAEERGKITLPLIGFQRMLGSTEEELMAAFNELLSYHVCTAYADGKEINAVDKQLSNSSVTVICRRMVREEKERQSNVTRQARYRERGGGDPDRWTAIRVHILERDEYTCGYCGRKANTVDHIIPRTKGGTEEFSNLVACCKSCNFTKNNRPLETCGLRLTEKAAELLQLHNNLVTAPISYSSSISVATNTDNTSYEVLSSERGEPPAPICQPASGEDFAAENIGGKTRKKKPWPDDGLYVKQFLDAQTYLDAYTTDPKKLARARAELDDAQWWESLSQEIGELQIDFLNRQFASMARWWNQNPARLPTVSGLKRHVGGWLKRGYERERKEQWRLQKGLGRTAI